MNVAHAVYDALNVIAGILDRPVPVTPAYSIDYPSRSINYIPPPTVVVVPSAPHTVINNVVGGGSTPRKSPRKSPHLTHASDSDEDEPETKPKSEPKSKPTKGTVMENIATGVAIGIVVGTVSKVAAEVYNRDATDSRVRNSFSRILTEHSKTTSIQPLPIEMLEAYNEWATYSRWTVVISYAEIIGLGVNAATLIAGVRLANPTLGWIGFTGLICLGGYAMFDYLTRDYDTKLGKLRTQLLAYYSVLTQPPPTY